MVSVASTRSNVDLPLPFSPTIATISPSRTRRSTESTARLNSCGDALRRHGRPRRPRRHDFPSLVTSTAMPPSPTLDTDVLLLTLLFSLLDKQKDRADRAARSCEQSFP